MLTNQDIYEEIEKIETIRESLKSEYEKAQLKGTVLLLKLLHNVRSNMVAVMKSQGIELIKPKLQQDRTTDVV